MFRSGGKYMKYNEIGVVEKQSISAVMKIAWNEEMPECEYKVRLPICEPN